MDRLAWSDGSKPMKSRKEDRDRYLEPKTIDPSHDTNSDHNYGNMVEQPIFRQGNTKREDANDKINERDMVGQTCKNPFFTKTTYVDDLEVQQNFLMPRSSNDKSI
jgi:hypothetical protein